MTRSDTNSPSLTPPQGNSRSSSPSSNPSGTGPQQRIVSGSIKDRIAKFNNPSAPPPIPKQHFAKGLGAGNSQGIQSRGLVGNRIPSLDPKTAGMINTGGGGARRISENRGLIGNRIPSMGSQGHVNPVTGQLTGTSTGGNSASGGTGTPPGSSTPAPGAKPGGAAVARSASPAGSIDSSVVSGTVESSTSPITSRSSSPPTSPGASAGGIPQNLLSATLPQLDDSGTGAATPSSTRAEAGDTVSELSLSVPSTPTATGTPPLPAPEYDLVAPNLKLATANAAANAGSSSTIGAGTGVAPNPMVRGLSAQSAASRAFAPSISSSLATQSRGSEEETQMMQDVSGVSTPMGTPRAARRELGEGSVVGEGSVIGENDVEELGNKLQNLEVDKEDQERTPEPPKEEQERGTAKIESREQLAGIELESGSEPKTDTGMGVDVLTETEEENEPRTPVSTNEKEIKDEDEDEDPNKASDLVNLKAGELESGSSAYDQPAKDSNPSEIVGLDVPANAIAGDAFAQNLAEHEISPEEKKEQGGEAGQRMEDVETADEVIPPEEEIKVDAGLEVREATPVVVGPDEKETKEGGKKGVAGSTQWFESSNEEKKGGEGDGTSLAVNTEGEAPDGPSKEAQPESNSRKSQSEPADSNETDTDGDKQVAPSTEIEQDEATRTEKRDHPIVVAEDQPEPDVSRPNPTVPLQARPESPSEPETTPEAEESSSSLTTAKTNGSSEPQLGKSYVDEKIESKEIQPGEITIQESQPSPAYEKESGSAAETGPEPKIVEDASTAPPPTSDEPIKLDELVSHPSTASTETSTEAAESQGSADPSSASPAGEDIGRAQNLETKTDQPPVAAIGAEVEKGEVAPSDENDEPKQLHLEPAPIAQPAETGTDNDNDDGESTPPASAIDMDKTPAAEIDPPTFPTPPTADPDVEDPIPSTPSDAGSASEFGLRSEEEKVIDIPAPPKEFNDASLAEVGMAHSASAASTPVDEAFLKSFPAVPDEEKPRVEVHVSSPATTPQKTKRVSVDIDAPRSAAQQPQDPRDDDEDISPARRKFSGDEEEYPQTPVASLPGHSKSLSNPQLYQDPSTAGSVGSMSGSASSNELDPDATPQASRNLSKRMSTRRSPKSPLLDDEDPGDFEPGEGWAVVTK
ncbi:hypothetical protein I316_07663 [Kwoniella heveanensis BCC8398]|uniref:Altered inheritance of mitochondria protein 21 n=1 Tax=Kwoniella heveanensis BCC8398 TaxID=1296120 RepID=A0A1B9GI19_9TREE|nr:hypothetical protein I316_07663 [Kwoniella heveanensis BCC8398]